MKEHLPKPGDIRWVLAGASGSGKTYLLVEMITKVYRGAWDRITIVSPSADIDTQWRDVARYIKTLKKQDGAPQFITDFDPEDFQGVIDDQTAKAAAAKKTGQKGPKMLIVLDDIADDGRYRNLKPLLTLYVRGRHALIDCVVSTQRFRFLPVTCRVNATAILLCRLRSAKDYEAIEEEVSATIEPEPLKAVYNHCVRDKKHGWVILNLMKPPGDKDQLLCGWDERIEVNG
jgi:GTPase SAR1 family protein